MTFLFECIVNWRRKRILKRETIADAIWLKVLKQLTFLRGLTPEETARLRELVILSWQGAAGIDSRPSDNVVIYEFAHKLGMRHQGANGYPILHANMSTQVGHNIFSKV